MTKTSAYRNRAMSKRRPVRRRPARRGGGKSSVASVTRIVKKQLSKAIEKKVADPVYSLPNTTINFGANSNTTSAGWQVLNINPDISQGIGESQRIGGRCSITSGHIQIQLEGMPQTLSPVKYKICLILRKNVSTSESPSTTIKNLFTPNVFTSLRDSDSGLNVANLSNYQILRTARGVLAPAQVILSTGFPAPAFRNVKMGFKFKTPLVQRFTSDSSTDTTRNDIILAFFAGNGSDINISTGISAKFYSQMYFQDA
ncbi:MAG: capsid protein [Circular genetic element sp.]|nr:MAG: capsid protein [Circular genetic element sp.]